MRFLTLLGAMAAAIAPAGAADLATRAATSPGGVAFTYTAMPDATESAVALLWRHGLETAPAGKEGAAAVAAYLLQDGPAGLPKGEFAERVGDLSLNMGAFAKIGATVFYLSAPAKKFAAAAEAAASVLANPRIDERRVIRLRRRLAEAHRQQLVHPESLAGHIALSAMLGDSAAVRANDPALIEALSPADVEAWRKLNFSRDDVVVAVAGAADEAAFGAAIDRLLAPLGAYAPPPEAPAPVKRLAGPLAIVMEADVPQTGLAIVMPTRVAAPLDGAVAALANQTLGGGIGARLSKALRQDLGATYGVSSSLERDFGVPFPLVVESALDVAKSAAALKRLREEYARWRADGVGEDEVEAARGQLLQEEDEARRDPVSMAISVGTGIARGLSPAQIDAVDARIVALTRADVNAAIKDKFTDQAITAIVTPKAEGFAADCVIHALSELPACLAKRTN